ncbi:hypothetical protein [Aeromonas veronii]|uniref:hypothetical protein n=1 Tax=Aeromonas veronii TaxID=654 RepID=UPI003D1C3CE8
MPFSDMMTDTVDVLKADGAKHANVKSIVDGTTITIMGPTFIVEHGDLVMRRMSNGGEETYKVLDPVFTEQFHDIPACYDLKVKKLGIPEAKAAVQHITYNFNGHNARVNNSSVDNSVNTVQIDNRAQTYINELREALKAAPLSAVGREEALEVADAIEAQFESGKPKKSVISALLAGLPALESIVAVTTGIAALVQ